MVGISPTHCCCSPSFFFIIFQVWVTFCPVIGSNYRILSRCLTNFNFICQYICLYGRYLRMTEIVFIHNVKEIWLGNFDNETHNCIIRSNSLTYVLYKTNWLPWIKMKVKWFTFYLMILLFMIFYWLIDLQTSSCQLASMPQPIWLQPLPNPSQPPSKSTAQATTKTDRKIL